MLSNGIVDPYLLKVTDEAMMFEGHVQKPRPLPEPDREWYPRSRYNMLIRDATNADEMRSVVDDYVKAGYGDLAVLGPNDPDVYSILPTFWEDEVAYIASLNKKDGFP